MNIYEQALDVVRTSTWATGEDAVKILETAGLLRDDHPDEGEVMAVRATGNNADLIADCFRLGYLDYSMRILDPTYGMGVFWKKQRPALLIGTDLDPAKSPGGMYRPALGSPVMYEGGRSVDFTEMFWPDNSFDAVVFDPDYKLQGTSSNDGPASSNHRYGMDRDYRSVEEQYGNIGKGLSECVRVTHPNGMVLVKYMSQVVSGSVSWMEREIPDAMEKLGCTYIDDLRLLGYRKQPTHDKCRKCDGHGSLSGPWRSCEACDGVGKVPRRQVHARRNYSVLGIFEVKG